MVRMYVYTTEKWEQEVSIVFDYGKKHITQIPLSETSHFNFICPSIKCPFTNIISLHLHVCVCARVCMHACVCVCTCMRLCVHACMCVCVSTHICVHVNVSKNAHLKLIPENKNAEGGGWKWRVGVSYFIFVVQSTNSHTEVKFKSADHNHCEYDHGIIIINPLTARVVGAPQMILQPVFSIFPCSPLPSGTCWSPGLSIPCCLPTSSSACLVFFPPSWPWYTPL